MQWLLRIFAFYLLSLSLLPCGDRLDCKSTELSQLTMTNNHEEHTDNDEHCSPICHCSCCGVQVATEQAGITITQPIRYQKLVITQPDFHLTPVYLPIWQPPQLITS